MQADSCDVRDANQSDERTYPQRAIVAADGRSVERRAVIGWCA